MKDFLTGSKHCSRCGGNDPNCFVCHEPTRTERAEMLREDRQRFFARRRLTQSALKTTSSKVEPDQA